MTTSVYHNYTNLSNKNLKDNLYKTTWRAWQPDYFINDKIKLDQKIVSRQLHKCFYFEKQSCVWFEIKLTRKVVYSIRFEMDPGTDVDHVLQSLGSLGKYQKIQLSFLFIFMLENAFHLIAANYVSEYLLE